jgi:hypothetical protein
MRFAFADKAFQNSVTTVLKPAGINYIQHKTSWVVNITKDDFLFLHQENTF